MPIRGPFWMPIDSLLREKVWARVTARTVELFHRGKRVAAHVRASANRKHTTVREHMPSSHRRYADWTPERLGRQAGEIGGHAAARARAKSARRSATLQRQLHQRQRLLRQRGVDRSQRRLVETCDLSLQKVQQPSRRPQAHPDEIAAEHSSSRFDQPGEVCLGVSRLLSVFRPGRAIEHRQNVPSSFLVLTGPAEAGID